MYIVSYPLIVCSVTVPYDTRYYGYLLPTMLFFVRSMYNKWWWREDPGYCIVVYDLVRFLWYYHIMMCQRKNFNTEQWYFPWKWFQNIHKWIYLKKRYEISFSKKQKNLSCSLLTKLIFSTGKVRKQCMV